MRPSIVSAKDHADRGRAKRATIHANAQGALSRVFEPLAAFALDAGLSIREVQSALRAAAVQSAADRQRDSGRRINISGIAASTGIPRAEISRLLKVAVAKRPAAADRQLQATNQVLKVWHEDPKYTNANGQPADLRVFGSGSTFDALVKRHGRGIPTRAMLDELARTGSVELTGSDKLRVKTSIALDRGINPQAVKAFGDRAHALLSVMLSTMRDPQQRGFLSSIEGAIGSNTSLPLIRREVVGKGTDFLADLRDRLAAENSSARGARRSKNPDRVSVTVFYHEKPQNQPKGKRSEAARRNLRRRV